MTIQNTANCVLVRYDGGHTYVDRADSHARKEIYVELRGVKDLTHARAIGAEVLALHREQRSTLSIKGTVLTLAQLAGAAWKLGDKMNTAIDGDPVAYEMIASISATADDRGYASLVPQLEDPVVLRLAAMDRRIARISSGVPSELAAPTINTQDQGKATDTTPPTFSQSGQVVTQLSPAWIVPAPYQCSWLEAVLVTAGTSSTRIRLYRTDVAGITTLIATLTLNAGDTRAVVDVNEGFVTKSKLTMAVDMAGLAAVDLTVTPRGAMVG